METFSLLGNEPYYFTQVTKQLLDYILPRGRSRHDRGSSTLARPIAFADTTRPTKHGRRGKLTYRRHRRSRDCTAPCPWRQQSTYPFVLPGQFAGVAENKTVRGSPRAIDIRDRAVADPFCSTPQLCAHLSAGGEVAGSHELTRATDPWVAMSSRATCTH